MTLCPGKRQPHAITGPWERDLDRDMDAIKDFGANLLITLMETPELAAAAVPAEHIRDAAVRRTIEWLHIPIVDFQPPGAAFETAWKARLPHILKLLQDGGSIVTHCRGGRGRSGTVAARLLVDLGHAPDAAIRAVRDVNPLAMETAVQEDYIRRLKED